MVRCSLVVPDPGSLNVSLKAEPGARVGVDLTFQDARLVKGRVDGRSDTLMFMMLSVHSDGSWIFRVGSYDRVVGCLQ